MTPRQRQGRRSAAVRIAGGVERDREQRRVRERARRGVEEVAELVADTARVGRVPQQLRFTQRRAPIRRMGRGSGYR